MGEPRMRDFIQRILRDMEGNALLSLASGKTEPTEASPDGKLIVDQHYWFAYPGELDLMVSFAESAYEQHRDAYLSPIIYGGEPFVTSKGVVIPKGRDGRPIYRRSKSNALYAQTVYMDSDAAPPEVFRIPPSLHVDTSPGHGHDYWYLAQPTPASLVAEIAHKITTAHEAQGTDSNGWSANKVLRLPTWNTGHGEVTEVVWAESKDAAGGEAWLLDDIAGAYDDIVVNASPTGLERELPPVPKIEGLPEFVDLIERIPQSERRLNDLIYKVPKTGDKGWRSEQLFALMLDLVRYGFADEEVIAIAWHAPASSKYKEDARGIDGLWWELQMRVKPTIEEERGDTISAAPAPAPKLLGPKLLDKRERDRVEGRSDVHTLWMAYARSRVQAFNAPLHEINGWTLLSVALGDMAVFPKDPNDLPMNLYSFTVVGSSMGKTEARSLLTPIVHRLPGDNPDIGARHSKEALIEQLIERDGRVSYINTDEADGVLAEIKGGYGTGIQQIWTDIYDGGVPSLGRVGRKELNVAGRRSVAVLHFVGTPQGIFEVIDKSMFYKGFLARVIWVLGDSAADTVESVRTKLRKKEEAPDAMPSWWAGYFASVRARLRAAAPLDRRTNELWPTDEAHERVDKAKWQMSQHFVKEQDSDLWRTITRRMGDIIWKFAGLRALSEGRTTIGLRDAEVGIYYAEKYLSTAVEIATRISDTFFSKQCDDIEAFISSREGQEADIGSIYRFRKREPKRVTDEFLQSLVYQGRVTERAPGPGQAGNHYYKIKERAA
jgi:hypothetical protein